jgi:hypothetical protein
VRYRTLLRQGSSCALAHRQAASKLTKCPASHEAIAAFVAAHEAHRPYNPLIRHLTATATTMQNFKNIESELKSKHLRASTAALESDLAANAVIRNWDAVSIAFVAMARALRAPVFLHCNVAP